MYLTIYLIGPIYRFERKMRPVFTELKGSDYMQLPRIYDKGMETAEGIEWYLR